MPTPVISICAPIFPTSTLVIYVSIVVSVVLVCISFSIASRICVSSAAPINGVLSTALLSIISC